MVRVEGRTLLLPFTICGHDGACSSIINRSSCDLIAGSNQK